VDRALRLETLREALGSHPELERSATSLRGEPHADTGSAQVPAVLPTVEELQQLLGETEARLFLDQQVLPDALLRTAWYLHGVASADTAAAEYTVPRQRRAFAVSAHIFDLASLSADRSNAERLRFAFAAEVGYHRSEAQPNALAVARRLDFLIRTDVDLLDHWSTLAVEAGVALLGLQPTRLRRQLRDWRRQMRGLADTIGVDDLTTTMFGPTFCVVEGADALMWFLTRGDREHLNRARERFAMAVTVPEGRGDHDARWVAAHMRFVADEMDAGSVWTLLPPSVPDGAKQAFTLTAPPILTLWQPQRQLLANIPMKPDFEEREGVGPGQVRSALDPSVRRLVLSVPTSSGKTLLAQLLMVTHLATASTGVCYVTPLRSLGREVRRSLARRLRVLAREVAREEPDFGLPEDSPMAGALRALGISPAAIMDVARLRAVKDRAAQPDVAVMTPERLSHALREDASAVLDRFGLFVFDEAHLIGERSRGFLLESILAFLHWRTRDTDHRIALLSAAMGNAGQLAAWLDVDGGVRLLESDWRGPRRLHAIFSTEIDWGSPPTVETVAARGGQAHLTRRLRYPTFGVVRLRPAEHQPMSVRTTEAIGETCFRAQADGTRERRPEQGHGTPFYRMLADIVRYVVHAGPVLVIRSTRRSAVDMAKAIAENQPDREAARPLVDLARARLGIDHPLVAILAKGVAYHHAGLPVELQEAIEDGIRDDALQFLVATSTLTEGVNLPVRTVVLADIPYEEQPLDQQLIGARLVNAMGRAGRATRESEGWVILAHAAAPLPADFEILEPDADALQVRSRLTDEAALDALAAFEDALRAGEDAIVAAHGAVADFASYLWFVLAAEEDLGRVGEAADPASAFAATLAYTQLDSETRERFERVVSTISDAYVASPPERRRWWAHAGTSIASARVLDGLADEIVAAVLAMSDTEMPDLTNPLPAVTLLERLGMFHRLLELSEVPRQWVFHRTESGQSPIVHVEPADLLRHWLTGQSLPQIADALLAEIPDRSFRIERLVDAVSDFCEHYFSWTLGALLGQVNSRLDESDAGDKRRLCPDLPVFIRYGVTSVEAVELRTSGLRSRELANRVSDAAKDDRIDLKDLRSWLGRMALVGWSKRFDATASDLLDLLEYSRTRDADVLRKLLVDGAVTVTVDVRKSPLPTEEELHSEHGRSTDGEGDSGDADAGAPGEPAIVCAVAGDLAPAPLAVFLAKSNVETPVADIPTSLHDDLQALLDTGLDVVGYLAGDQLTLRLVEEPSE